MNVLIKSATILDPESPYHESTSDILIKNGRIEAIAKNIDAESNFKIIEKEDLHVSQGWFDYSVSFGEPGFEERETLENGLQVAALSGFTHIGLNPNTLPVPDTKSDITYLKERAAQHAVNLFPIGALTKESLGNDLAEMYDMQTAGAFAFYDYKFPIKDANVLKIALQYVSNFNGLVFSFPQDVSVSKNGIVNEHEASMKLGLKGIPNLAESLQVSRDLHLLSYTGGALHIPTISTAESVQLIRDAKKQGLNVSCSVAIHNLIATDNLLESFDTNFKVLPPLRTKTDCDALIKGLKDNVIDLVTADHCPIEIEHKQLEFDKAAFGSIGLESGFGALTSIMDVKKSVAFLTNGYKLFNIPHYPIKIGEQANLSLFNPKLKYTFKEEHIASTSKNALLKNFSLKGKAYGIYANSKLILND